MSDDGSTPRPSALALTRRRFSLLAAKVIGFATALFGGLVSFRPTPVEAQLPPAVECTDYGAIPRETCFTNCVGPCRTQFDSCCNPGTKTYCCTCPKVCTPFRMHVFCAVSRAVACCEVCPG